MRIGIVTFHFVNNFGGALQAYALQKVIEQECKADAVIVDYRNWFIHFTDTVRILPITTNVKEFVSGWLTMGARLGRLDKFKDFAAKKYQMTKFYSSASALKNNLPDCDKYVCGSDQIWNTAITLTLATPYFLTFESESNNKFSYAPSFGSNHVNQKYAAKMGTYLSALGDISVRESEGVQLVRDLTGREAVQLIDPTFLLAKEKWVSVAVEPKTNEPYILLYIMQRDEDVYAYAKQIKDRLGIKVVEISRYGYKPDFVDESLVDLGPAEFLGLFQNAAYVCTNSYHGLAFSLIFEKEFCLIPCKRFSSRITSLVELLHIELPQKQQADSAVYDKARVQEILAEERRKSIEYLRKNIWKGQ